jgi:hypothetical protein
VIHHSELAVKIHIKNQNNDVSNLSRETIELFSGEAMIMKLLQISIVKKWFRHREIKFTQAYATESY